MIENNLNFAFLWCFSHFSSQMDCTASACEYKTAKIDDVVNYSHDFESAIKASFWFYSNNISPHISLIFHPVFRKALAWVTKARDAESEQLFFNHLADFSKA